ncbi:uncharacterized protein [Elaeis guineensis]|uniref:uncharacterized protein isoform X1 n=1 Tax=Elaeis guineensis var. tenera TaxID=51953 RepID=UPI00057A3C45
MAKEVVAKSLLFFFLFSLHTVCSSATIVGFSYDAREENPVARSLIKTLSFLQKNDVSPSQFKVFFTDPAAFVDLPPTTSISVDLCLDHLEVIKQLKSKASTTSWLKTHLLDTLPYLNISNIIVGGTPKSLSLLLSTLNTIQTSLKSFDLDQSIRVSAMFPLYTLKTLDKSSNKNFLKMMNFIKNSKSFIVVETLVDGEMSLGDGFVQSTIQKAIAACTSLPYPDIPIVLNVKGSVAPSGVEIAEFTERMTKSVDHHALIRERIFGVFAEISHVREFEQKKLSWEEGLVFPSSHRELLDHDNCSISSNKTTVHDTLTPVTNPATTPITVPSTNPAPTVVTVPSANPVTVFPTNPTTAPITIPPLNSVPAPFTVPATNPMPTPVTTPVVPVTNPATTPTTLPVNPPVTNPVTTYPYPPSGSTPSVTTPVTVPSTVPVSPTVSGQTWCVAKTGALDAALQMALDYACGIGGADCSTIQPTGSCYNPNTLQAHASYAFNSYYQKNPVPTSCDFGGTAMIADVNPSSGMCMYPSSSSVSGFNPASTSTGSSSGSSVLNTNNSGGSSTVFGSDNPTGATSNSFSVSAGWTLLLFVLAIAYIPGNI